MQRNAVLRLLPFRVVGGKWRETLHHGLAFEVVVWKMGRDKQSSYSIRRVVSGGWANSTIETDKSRLYRQERSKYCMLLRTVAAAPCWAASSHRILYWTVLVNGFALRSWAGFRQNMVEYSVWWHGCASKNPGALIPIQKHEPWRLSPR